jgi:hypothetical protein
VRRFQVRVAVVTSVTPTLVIGHHQDHVGSIGCIRRRDQKWEHHQQRRKETMSEHEEPRETGLREWAESDEPLG